MPKGYWIPHLDVSNPEGFQAYRDTADAAHKRFGSKLLARGGRREVVEGVMRARNVLREFNSYEEAHEFYHGPEYSKAHPLREPHSVCDFLIVEGYSGPQPKVAKKAPQPAALRGYWIAHIDVLDPEGYGLYQDAVGAVFGAALTLITWPVMNDAAGEAKNRTGAATSSGRASRRNGIALTRASLSLSG